MLPLNERITVTAPQGTIGAVGMDAILSFISQQRVQDGDWKTLNPTSDRSLLPSLPDNWDWCWTVKKGVYAGTMPKRISNYYHKVHQLKCPTGFLTQIGNLARQHAEDNASYTFDFTDRFDWQAGDFGDRGSCLWGGRSEAREVMADNGTLAVRFYKPEGKGFGRAWFYETCEKLYTVWNGYGFEGDSTLIIARVMALYLNTSYKRVWLKNNGTDSGLVYINSGRGFLIGAADMIAGYEHYELDFGGDDHHCESCGRGLDEDDLYRGADENDYCERCFYQTFDTCARCGSTHYHENLSYVERTGESYCDFCLNRYYTCCDKCEEYYPNDETKVTGEQTLCIHCFIEADMQSPPAE